MIIDIILVSLAIFPQKKKNYWNWEISRWDWLRVKNYKGKRLQKRGFFKLAAIIQLLVQVFLSREIKKFGWIIYETKSNLARESGKKCRNSNTNYIESNVGFQNLFFKKEPNQTKIHLFHFSPNNYNEKQHK